MTLSFIDIANASAQFHAQHNALHPFAKLDVLSEEYHLTYLKIQLHDALHWYLQLTVSDEDLLASIEARLDNNCTHLAYLAQYTDRLPAGFQALWNAAKSNSNTVIYL